MSLQESLEKFQNDLNNLDPENIGGWPLPVKVLCWVMVTVAVVIASYQGVLKDEGLLLDTERQKEQTLRQDFEKKVQDAANIEAYRQQMVEMEANFSNLLNQLPKDTEVPGLLDDITNKGQDSGLNFSGIDLQQEKKAEFYVELPINIKVMGGYHDFGSFVSGVAGLPRIVTLHDFVIQSAELDKNKAAAKQDKKEDRPRGSEELSMTITAKTYRYKASEEGGSGK